MGPRIALACSQPDRASIEAAFDLAADGALPASYPSIPSSSGVRAIPPSILKAVGWVESGWRQFTPAGRPLVSFDFGYGIMQITSGMSGAFDDVDGSLDAATQSRIASDYRYNIAYGAGLLAMKWSAVPRIGTGDPSVVEDWYYALWAYNGWGWTNNPNNPRFSRAGTPATNPTAFPYQERVLYLVAHPPQDADGQPLWQPVPVSLPSAKTIGNDPQPLTAPRHPHRQPPLALSAAFSVAEPGAVPAGSRAVVAVRVTNTGTAVWDTAATGQFSLTYHLLDARASPYDPISPFSPGVLAFGQGVHPLPPSIAPGKSVSVQEPVSFPANPGRYLIVWDIQQGNNLWFSQTGSFPRVQPVVVIGPGTAPPAPTRTPTSQPAPALSLLYVADTSVKDGTTVQAGATLRKGWLVFNNGKTAWDSSLSLRLVSGRSFGARTIPVPAVPPCHSWNLVATLRAPSAAGRYTSVWQVQTAGGRRVGDRLTVVVQVRSKPTATPTPGPITTPTATPRAGAKPTPTLTPVG